MSDKPVAERLQVKGGRRLAVIGASAELEKTIGAGKARGASRGRADRPQGPVAHPLGGQRGRAGARRLPDAGKGRLNG